MIKRNSTFIRLIAIVSFFIYSSCETSTLSELSVELDEVDVVTYENTARAILDNACVECHNINEQTAGVRLDDFDFAFIEANNGRMLARMTDTTNPMPPSGNLPDNLIQGIIDWVDDGILEN